MSQADSPLHVTREIPIVWLIGVVVGLIVQAAAGVVCGSSLSV